MGMMVIPGSKFGFQIDSVWVNGALVHTGLEGVRANGCYYCCVTTGVGGKSWVWQLSESGMQDLWPKGTGCIGMEVATVV